MSANSTQCPFCGGSAKHAKNQYYASYHEFDCETCLRYNISQSALEYVKEKKRNGSYSLVNCISENIKHNTNEKPNISWHLRSQNLHLEKYPEVFVKNVESVLSAPISHVEKPSALLNLVARKLRDKHPFTEALLNQKDLLSVKIADIDEAINWLETLKSQGLINSFGGIGTSNLGIPIYMSPAGWAEIQSSNTLGKSNKVFIAMAFNWGTELNEIKSKYLSAIQDACTSLGYEADIVSQHHTGHIVDKIVAEIRDSKFIIADFTFNNRGAYFEAGYARALGKHVIHTVMEGHTDGDDSEGKRLHFDIQQINYIKWSDTEELKERIKDRIKAVIEEEIR